MVSGLDFITMLIAPMLLDMPKQLLPTYTDLVIVLAYYPVQSFFLLLNGQVEKQSSLNQLRTVYLGLVGWITQV